MDWGSGNHFLKIEMDATGGTNYAMIGTTQMMSVPYALYAKSAGIDSAAIAAMIKTLVMEWEVDVIILFLMDIILRGCVI